MEKISIFIIMSHNMAQIDFPIDNRLNKYNTHTHIHTHTDSKYSMLYVIAEHCSVLIFIFFFSCTVS